MSNGHRIRKKIIVSLGTTVQKREWSESLLDVGIRIKTFSSRSRYLVASSVTDSYYRRAIALGIFVVNEEFLQRCEKLDSSTDIAELAESCRLPRFAGLTITFLGFNDETIEDHARTVEENGGQVTTTTSDATHLIVAPGLRPPASCHGKNLVTMEWFRESLDLGWCANEACFVHTWEEPTPRRRHTNSILRFQRRYEAVRSSYGYFGFFPLFSFFFECFLPLQCINVLRAENFSSTALFFFSELSIWLISGHYAVFSSFRRRAESSAKKYKRYQLCLELFKTEINCLKACDFLVRLCEENIYVSAEANDVMFGVFGAMRKAHDRIVQKMGEVLDTWNDNSTIGDIFVDEELSLTEAYSPYFHTLEASLQYIKENRKQNAKFNAFIVERERDRSLGKQKLEYLLNIPFQQITSRIPASLKEIRNQTTTIDPDHEPLANAITAVDRMLAHLLKSPKQFVCGMQFMSMSDGSTPWNFILVELLLFKDCILVFLTTGRRIPIDIGDSTEFDDTTLNDNAFDAIGIRATSRRSTMMFFYVLCILSLTTGLSSDEPPIEKHRTCEDRDDYGVCKKIWMYNKCYKRLYLGVTKEMCRKSCGFC
ncbi:BRCA1 protein [Ancylostoma ceylanicum]|uniref:BRCA1 protein n=1 Tax=Ancylostoma ceylanicum TaxID=53326 RepID=A0A0D6LJN5_9BILA|nr:BRCA1 protein [Ancylostoma ceylanicum]